MKILAIMLSITTTSCGTLFNVGGDKVITVTTDKTAKLYLNGRYIGTGSATTYASGRDGTDILSAAGKGCVEHVNIKKTPSPLSWMGNFVLPVFFTLASSAAELGLGLFVPVIMYVGFMNIDFSSDNAREVITTNYAIYPCDR